MFEEALLTAPPPEVAPPVGWETEPPYDDPRVDSIDEDLLRELCTGGEAAPAVCDIDQAPVGPELAARLARLDPAVATADELVEAVAASARLAAWVAGVEAGVSAELASRAEMRPDATGCRSVNPVTNTAMAVAGRCQVTAKQAQNQVGHALQLVLDFPDTHAALASGAIDLRRARVITDELGGQEPHVLVRVEAAVLPKAPGLDSVALRKLIKRLLHELAPVEAADRYEAARERRYVAITPASDGMAHLEALLPAADAAAIDTALNAAAADAKRADTAAGLPARTKDQRRADALAELGWAALTACADGATGPLTRTAGSAGGPAHQTPAAMVGAPSGADTAAGQPPPTPSGSGAPRRRPISVHITVPFATAVGLSDQPGELEGYGPIPAHVAKVLAAEGVWTWLRTDGSGQLLDLGRTRYRPTKALADFIIARDKTCRAPGCHRPAIACDLDHIVPFAAGGTTNPDDLQALCATHHKIKHHGHWRVERHPDGTTTWTSPSGHRYEKPPDGAGP
ncbi:HNH endonuclease [Jiangella aurantiaca]|uniref:HNH endonuclease n=1 Tax=Jiangella aurantiaca TaxID=2530373 RepID=A0A4R5AEP1_9ACTN|nr:HNH endonuclease signature motif containing protein [Jiangella aurantiaca]TDD70195.1 HNH endonuclease [Jiangella aurantiaca]